MSARERVAQKSGDIKVFLMPQEVGLLVSCLNWVQADLMRAADNWETNTDLKKQMPKEVLTSLIPVIQVTADSVLLHSRAHYEERHDKKGLEFLQEKLDKLDKETTEVQALVHLVKVAMVTKNIRSQS
jgi:hypothetical protein